MASISLAPIWLSTKKRCWLLVAFDPNLGRQGTVLLSGEESAILAQLQAVAAERLLRTGSGGLAFSGSIAPAA